MDLNILERVKRRGHLLCGVSRGIHGMSFMDEARRWRGFDVDFGRAIAAAVFGDAERIAFVSLSPGERFAALEHDAVDLLCCNATYTLCRDVGLGVSFVTITCIDGETIMVRRDLGVVEARKLRGLAIAFQAGTTTEMNIRRHLEPHGVTFTPRSYDTPQDAQDAYERGECDAYALDRIPLTGERLQLAHPEDHVLLSETFSKEPMGPVVKAGNPCWEKLVRWVVYLLIEAEELEVSAANIGREAGSAMARHLLEISASAAKHLGLDPRWAFHVIAQLGNYEEIFHRNLGNESRLGLSRGMNDLWSRGGLLYAPPFK